MVKPSKDIYRRLIVVFVILGAFYYLLATTWGRWGSLHIDTFRDPSAVERILAGEVLYKDFFYEYGFLPLYFLVFMCSVFGVHLLTFTFCGVIVTFLVTVFLYKIALIFVNEIISTLTVLTFLFVLAFGCYQYIGIFNFILPYSFASTVYILFGTIALYYFLRFVQTEKERYLVLWNIALCAAMFSRITMPLLVWGGFIFAGVVYIIKRRPKHFMKVLVYLISPLIITTIGYFSFLAATGAFGGFRESVIDHVLETKTNIFVIVGMGFEDIPRNIFRVVQSFNRHMLCIGLLGIGCMWVSSFSRQKKGSLLVAVLGICVVTAVFLLAPYIITVYIQFQCLSLLLVTGILFALIRLFRSPDYKESISLLTLFSVSLLAMTRVILRANVGGYGFYVLVPGLICYYVFFFEVSKGLWQLCFKNISMKFFSTVLVCFFAFFILLYWNSALWIYSNKTIGIVTDRGTFFSWRDTRTVRFWEAVEYLREKTAQDSTVIVVPEGSGINFFAERANPLKYYCTIPPLFEITPEEEVVHAFVQAHADYIVVVSRTTVEYGYPFFGIHYGQNVNTWIKEQYVLEKMFGPYPFTTPEYGIAIYRRAE